MKSANFHPGYIGLPVLCFLFFTACLKFGKDIELSGDAFDPATLAKVATLTGLRFPAGARGVEYLYCGSGIDDSLAAKIEIPDEGVDEFMNNPVFSAGIDAKPSIQIGRGKQWWKIEQLARRVDPHAGSARYSKSRGQLRTRRHPVRRLYQLDDELVLRHTKIAGYPPSRMGGGAIDAHLAA